MQRGLRRRRQEISNIQQAKVGEAFAKFFYRKAVQNDQNQQ